MKQEKVQKRLRRKKRIRSRIYGTAEKPRLSVFRSLRSIEAQLIDDSLGKTLVGASTRKEKKGSNRKAAQKLGTEIGKRALELKISTCVFDRSGYKFHGRVKALAEGAREAGLKF
ncbi:50S ribosomal protein L18 [Candidatus Peregrinibacteria bacterium]|nr:50S ribosomal protein L18 [Candidatus Peregrinibacteria bacterium]